MRCLQLCCCMHIPLHHSIYRPTDAKIMKRGAWQKAGAAFRTSCWVMELS